MNTHTFDTVLLRFVAVLLITNSHMDALYPDPRFATGGSLGNALFFAISGFGLAISAAKSMPNFYVWSLRRLGRIYPQVFLVILVIGLLSNTLVWRPLWVGVTQFLWPERFWFVSAIVVFYIPIYVFLRFLPTRLLQLTVVMVVPYFLIYFTALDLKQFAIEGDYFRWIFYFAIMLFGAYLAHAPALRQHRTHDATLLLVTLLIYFIVKLLLSKGLVGDWQFSLHVLTVPFVFYSFRLFANPSLLSPLKKMRCYAAVALLGGLSLEVYLVQGYLIHWLADQHLSFSLSMMAIWPLIFISAYLVSTICTRTLSLFTYKKIATMPLEPRSSVSKGVP